MSEAIIVAIITGTFTLIGTWMLLKGDQKKRTNEEIERDKKRAVEQAVKDERLENRLSSIESKLDTHNGYADKITTMSQDIAVIKNDIKTLYKEGGAA